ncbi:hypothetical protein LJC49_06315 [Ruminococcaceae bacterium OttesenSCG-928-I18]|nr:hypothetical protein [Ruminococcaceae bacterium OttesenSCG-928-I18]
MLKNRINATKSVRVIGIGGAGGNAVAAMQKQRTSGTEYIVMNTDEASLEANPCREKLLLSQSDAMESRDSIKRYLEGGRLVVLVAGLGGDAGTNATPVVARIAKEMGIPVLCLVTFPIRLEGEKRLAKAKQGAKNLQDIADCVAVLHTEQLVASVAGYTTLNQAFDKGNDTLRRVVEGTATIVHNMGDGFNVDTLRDRLQDNGYISKDEGSLWKIGEVSGMTEIHTGRNASEPEDDAKLTTASTGSKKSNDMERKNSEETEGYPCYSCDGWDETGGDCYRTSCSRNKHKYGEVPYASDLYPKGE